MENEVRSVPCLFRGCASVVFVSSVVPTGTLWGKEKKDEAALGLSVTVGLTGPVQSWSEAMF